MRPPSRHDESTQRGRWGAGVLVALMAWALLVHPRLHVPHMRAWPASAHGRDALDIKVPNQPSGSTLGS